MRRLFLALPVLAALLAAATVAGAAEPVVPTPALDGSALRGLLLAGRHGELDARLATLPPGLAGEEAAAAARDALADAPADAARRLDAWVDAQPAAAWPRLGRAAHRAATARGTDGDERTARLRGALEDATAALDDPATALAAHGLAMLVAAELGDGERLERLRASGLEREPASYEIRRAEVLALAPRWGGTLSRMRRAAKEGQNPELLALNPRLAWLEGLPELDRGRVSAARGAHTRAIVLYGDALAHGPDPEVLAARAHARIADERWGEALADAEAALQARPGMLGPLLDRAVALYELGRREEGLAALALVTDLDPENATARRWRERWAGGHLRAASRRYAERSLEEALAEYDAAVALAPDDARAHHGRALTLEGLGRPEDAVAALERSLDADPSLEATYLSLDRLLSRSGEWGRLAAAWSRFLRVEPGNARAYVERAGARLAQGRRRDAIQDAERACGMGEPRGCAFLKRHAGD